MNEKLKPAIVGGLVVGLLSAIPFVNIANICCCLWAILGGALAAYLYVKNSANPVRSGEGAMIGVLAGVVGAAIYIVIGIPIGIVAGNAMIGVIVDLVANSDPAQAEQLRRQMEANQSVVGAILMGLVWAVFLVVFSTVGGLIGVAIFEKRKGGPTPPPPPQDFGTGPAGGFGSAV